MVEAEVRAERVEEIFMRCFQVIVGDESAEAKDEPVSIIVCCVLLLSG